MPTILYLAQVSLYWLLLYACYWLLLRRHTFFAWNRAYLLASLLGAFALPLVEYPEAAPPIVYKVPAWAVSEVAVEPMADFSAPAVVEAAEQVTDTPWLTWPLALWVMYLAGLLMMGVRLGRHYRRLMRFINSLECIDMETYRLYLLPNDAAGSFSFLHHIVLNRTDYEHNLDTILTHELAHVRQRHSWDILLVEVLRVLFWFNPMLLLYKRSLQQVHEYLADREVCAWEAPRDGYAEFMLSYALRGAAEPLVNSFFKSSLLKDRIMMLYKSRNSNWSLGRYAVVALLTGLVALLAASCEKKADGTDGSDSGKTEATAPQALDTVEIGPMKVSGDFKLIPNYVEDSVYTSLEDSVYTVVNTHPIYPGGIKAMYKFVQENIKYPAAARRANVEGKVFLTFVVRDNGAITDIKVLKGLGFGLDEEAIRVVSAMPRWEPGQNEYGEKVNVKYNLPIAFELPEKNRSSARLGKSKNSFATAQQTGANAQVDSLIGLKFQKPGFKNRGSQFIITEGVGKSFAFRGSASGPNAPLLVIDGVPQPIEVADQMLKAISTDDLRRIDVFEGGPTVKEKYGVRAANGVVEITTKQGEKMPLDVKK